MVGFSYTYYVSDTSRVQHGCGLRGCAARLSLTFFAAGERASRPLLGSGPAVPGPLSEIPAFVTKGPGRIMPACRHGSEP